VNDFTGPVTYTVAVGDTSDVTFDAASEVMTLVYAQDQPEITFPAGTNDGDTATVSTQRSRYGPLSGALIETSHTDTALTNTRFVVSPMWSRTASESVGSSARHHRAISSGSVSEPSCI